MSHFARADEADKTFSHAQTEIFRGIAEQARAFGVEYAHMANSAAIFDIPDSHLDAARPGVAIYGLAPSANIANPRVRELEPVLEWKTQIAFLNETAGRDRCELRARVPHGRAVAARGACLWVTVTA